MRKWILGIFMGVWWFFFMNVLILSGNKALAQGTIQGTVVDSSTSEPMPGVNVGIQNSALGDATNGTGEFQISNVPVGTHVLTASFIGFESVEKTIEVSEGETVQVNFQLAPETYVGEEIVVTGYGNVEERTYTGSVSSISNKDIEEIPVTSVGQALKGNVSGANISGVSGTPGAVQEILIRGSSSINAGTDPLYVIDGVPVISGNNASLGYTSSLDVLANINPSDISSVSILKGPHATAPYGARGATGVIVIETKEGREGDVSYTVSAQRGFSNPTINGPDPMTASQWDQFYRDAVANDPSTNISREQVNSPWDGVTNTNWVDVARNQNAPEQQYTLSARGGNDRTTFYVSGNYFDKMGSSIGTSLKRISGKINITHELDDRLTVTNHLNGSYVYQDGGLENGGYFGNPAATEYSLMPIDRAYNEDGTPNLDLSNNLYNPLYVTEHNIHDKRSNRILNNTILDFQILDNLSFNTRFAIDFLLTEEKLYENAEYGSGEYLGGRVVDSDSRNFNYVWKNNLQYEWLIDENNVFDFRAIAESQKNDSRYLSGYGQGTTSGLYNLSSTSSPVDVSSITSDWSSQSFTGIVNYSYQEKYLVSGSIRREANSRFSQEKRWGTFWSFSLGYVLTEEEYMQDISWLDYLKIRASYGKTGNASIGLNEYQTTVGFGSYNDQTTILPDNFGNRNLTWENQKGIDVGINFTVFGDRLDGSVTYYRKNSYDLLYSVPLSLTTGESSQIQNLGELYNQGLEIELSADIVQTSNFLWNLGGNLSINENEVTDLPDDPNGNPRRITSSTQYIAVEGYELNAWHMKEWAGVDPENGDPLWYMDVLDENGNPTGERTTTNNWNMADSYYQGTNPSPDIFGGINTRFDVFNFYIRANLYYEFGSTVYNSSGISDGGNLFSGHYASQMDYWKGPGDQVVHPKPISGGNNNSTSSSTRFLKDGDYLRLRTLRVGYNIPLQFVASLGLKSADLYFMGQNLWTYTFDDNLKIDPAKSPNNPVPLKSVTFGMNIKF